MPRTIINSLYRFSVPWKRWVSQLKQLRFQRWFSRSNLYCSFFVPFSGNALHQVLWISCYKTDCTKQTLPFDVIELMIWEISRYKTKVHLWYTTSCRPRVKGKKLWKGLLKQYKINVGVLYRVFLWWTCSIPNLLTDAWFIVSHASCSRYHTKGIHMHNDTTNKKQHYF